jgi:hypothetical protein
LANLKNYLSKSIALALVAFGLSGCGGGGTSEAANVEFKSLPTDMTVGRGK